MSEICAAKYGKSFPSSFRKIVNRATQIIQSKRYSSADEMLDEAHEVEIPYIVGDTVKVNNGPFSGFDGVIEDVNSDKRKLKVMVKIFGRKTPLELDFTQVVRE